jgi:hypothetical protein
MFHTLTSKQLSDRHVRLSKIVLFVSTVFLVLVLSQIHHKHSKHHHRFSGSHSASHGLEVATDDSTSYGDEHKDIMPMKRVAKQLEFDEDEDEVPAGSYDDSSIGEEDEEENEMVDESLLKPKSKKSLSNSHSLSHMMKKHFRKHLTAPSCSAQLFSLLVATVGVFAGFSGSSRLAFSLICALTLSAGVHVVAIISRSVKICRTPESADMCAHIHKLVGAMVLGSLVHHLLMILLAVRYFCICRFVEAQHKEYTVVPIAGVVCAEQDMEPKSAV